MDILGQGAYGSVSKAMELATGELYAIKILSATSLSEITAIKKEIQILKLCDNEHIVKYYGSYFKDNNLWIVLEYCHAGSVIDLLNITQKKLNEYEIASILESVLKGLVYLHDNKKIHRDIKAANILLNKDGVAKLADFGVSAESMYTNAGHKSQVGSPYWMSPEVMKHNEYTNKTDIWSLGVTAIELAEGVVPNSHLKPLIAMWQLKDKPIQQLKEPHRWSPEFNSFIRDCLNINPHLRPEARTLLRHDFILNKSRGQNLLAELVQKSQADIEEFRLGQEREDSEGELMDMLNGSVAMETKTIVHNPTSRSRESQLQSHEEQLESSMIVKENSMEGSMIINENDSSMIVVEGREGQPAEKPSSFLNRYVAGLKQNDNQLEHHREQLKKQVLAYDDICLQEVEAVFKKHKETINGILVEGLNDQFFGMDMGFIRKEFNSKLLECESVKDFLSAFPQYHPKEFERSDLAKKKSEFSEKAHHSTQTNDPGYADLSQFKEGYPRGVKSQEFNEKEFKTGEKHYFNSNSIISDIENVKYKNDRFDRQTNKRFVATEPHEWISLDRKPLQDNHHPVGDKARLKQQFLLDPDVKESLMNHLHSVNKFQEPNTAKHDRIA